MFYVKWFNKLSVFTSFGEYYQEDPIPNQLVFSLLGIEKDNLKPFTIDLLDYLESDENFQNLKRGYHSYLQFQDILNLTIEGSEIPLENRHYCYYESIVYFRESVISWLDGNVLAAITLLRPFLELSIMHLYCYLRSEEKGYGLYYDWFNRIKDKPPFNNQLGDVFDKILKKTDIGSSKLKNRKTILQNMYSALCSYNHTPRIEESIFGMGQGRDATSFDSFYYYLVTAKILIKQIIFLYILAYPMSLFPVNCYQKWGFHGVKGIFFDDSNYRIIKSYLGENNINQIRNGLNNLDEVITLKNWYHQFPDLTESEIEDDWKNFIKDKDFKDVSQKGGRIALFKAYMRALGWSLNYVNNKPPEVVSDDLVNKLNTRLFDW